jgi:hypothetical protein
MDVGHVEEVVGKGVVIVVEQTTWTILSNEQVTHGWNGEATPVTNLDAMSRWAVSKAGTKRSRRRHVAGINSLVVEAIIAIYGDLSHLVAKNGRGT